MAVTVGLTLLSQLFTPFAYILSGAPLALVCLRKGVNAAAQVMLGCLLILLLLALALEKLPPALPVACAILIWLPVMFCSHVLRTTHSHGMMMLAVGGVGVVFLICFYSYIDQVWDWWKRVFDAMQTLAADEAAERLKEIYKSTEQWLSAMFVFFFLCNLVVTLLFARWWQSLLFNRGGFRDEFYRLRLPAWLTCFTLLLGGLLLIQPGSAIFPLRDLMTVLMLLYLFQGLSAAHRIVHAKKLNRGWLVITYCLLLLPQTILVMSCFGMAATWLGQPAADAKNGD